MLFRIRNYKYSKASGCGPAYFLLYETREVFTAKLFSECSVQLSSTASAQSLLVKGPARQIPFIFVCCFAFKNKPSNIEEVTSFS